MPGSLRRWVVCLAVAATVARPTPTPTPVAAPALPVATGAVTPSCGPVLADDGA